MVVEDGIMVVICICLSLWISFRARWSWRRMTWCFARAVLLSAAIWFLAAWAEDFHFFTDVFFFFFSHNLGLEYLR